MSIILTEKIENIPHRDNLKSHLEWINKYSKAIEKHSGSEIRKCVLEVIPSNYSEEKNFIDFERNAIQKLDILVSEDNKRKIFSECSCEYPIEKLKAIKIAYAETKDIHVAHAMLQKQFEKDLDKSMKKEIIDQNMGPAGVLENDKIIITVVPKEPGSYFSTTDSLDKRYHYCNCDRIRSQILENKQSFSENYCYCGTGFYKKIWEEILGKELKVDIIETVLKGSSVCRFIIS